MKDNYRNGSYDKKVRSQFGDINLKIPRDRNAEFEPQVVPKFQYDISFIEGAVIKLYSGGMSTRDISSTLHKIYGIDVEPSFVSRITDKIIATNNWVKKQTIRKRICYGFYRWD
ncbi:transposase [Mycoplasmopsis felis]|uniref:transposase n=1 Tax=Mycoplasmopsis felis TaxID=33923 RepID=UPI0021E0EBA6|nr:transposase [Mycoplasmopsis felis]MCU9934216.1 transposase [Mycoplasmopsis felis]